MKLCTTVNIHIIYSDDHTLINNCGQPPTVAVNVTLLTFCAVHCAPGRLPLLIGISCHGWRHDFNEIR